MPKRDERERQVRIWRQRDREIVGRLTERLDVIGVPPYPSERAKAILKKIGVNSDKQFRSLRIMLTQNVVLASRTIEEVCLAYGIDTFYVFNGAQLAEVHQPPVVDDPERFIRVAASLMASMPEDSQCLVIAAILDIQSREVVKRS